MTKKMIILLAIIALYQVSFGSVRFSATTERTNLVIGEQIVVTATLVSNKALKGLAAPPLQSTEYYTVTNVSRNQHQSSSIQVVQGKMTQTVEITYLFYYHLTMKKAGRFTFPALTANIGGQRISSKLFHITVGKEAIKNDNLIVRIRINRKSLYKGEQAVLTAEVAQKLQAPVEVTTEGFMAIISTVEKTFGQTFSINRLFKDKVGQAQKRIKGELYKTYSLAFSIIPLKSGSITLPSIPFQFQELRQSQRGRRDLFDDFFGGSFFGGGIQRIGKTAFSNKLTLTVKSLPAPPSDFSGAVGTFSLNANLSEQSVPAGEAVTLSISLRGSTRPGNMGDITLRELDGFEVFTPEKHVYIDTTAKGITARKKYKYLIIPQQEGVQTVPAIQWTYFDPNRGAYNTATTENMTLTVTKGKKGAKAQTRYLTQEDIREVGRDIRYIKSSKKLVTQSTKPYTRAHFLILFPIPFLILLFSLLYRIQATVLRKDLHIQLSKKAYAVAQKRIVLLRKELPQTTFEKGIAKIAETVEQFISNRFGFPAVGKTLDELKTALASHKVDQAVTDMVVLFLEELDLYRFGGGGETDTNRLEKALDKTKQLIDDLSRKEKRV